MALGRWKDLCIDATDPAVLAAFWGGVLGLTIEQLDDGDAVLRGEQPEQTIWINGVPEPRTVKQRVHLDLHVRSVEPLLALGATHLVPSSASGLRWEGLADPEGGELCAFVRQGAPVAPPASLYELVVDTSDADAAHSIAMWWAGVLGGKVVDDERGYSWLEQVPGLPFESMDFVPVPEPKTVKNRIHWDLVAPDVGALLAHGATVIARPAPSTPWHVLADPQGNEFCAFPAD